MLSLTRTRRCVVPAIATLALAFQAFSAQAAEITVTGTGDTANACAVAEPVVCDSLRSAIIYANETPGADSITLEAGTYTLTIHGVDERCDGDVPCTGTGTPEDPYEPVVSADASIGDLDITEDLTITGAGPDQTIIQWGDPPSGDDDPLSGDRIFHVQTDGANIDSVVFEGLAVRNGEVGLVPTDPSSVDTPNDYDIEIVDDTAGSVTIWQFRRMGGAIALGGGYAVVLYEESVHGPDGGGGDAPDDIGPYPGGKPGEEEGYAINSVTFDRVAILGSWSGADAGGLYNAAPSTIEDSLIGGNFAGANGGGIYNDAELTLIGTTLGGLAGTPPDAFDGLGDLSAGNVGENGGGMFDTGFHTTNIIASSISLNEAIGGGGIGGRALVVINILNSTISGNYAFDVGGGITTNGTVNLRSSTVAFNASDSDAPGGGGGLNSFGSGTYHLLNTIVAGNTKAAGEGEEAGTVIVNCGCSGGTELCTEGRMVSLGYNMADDPVLNTCFLVDPDDLSVPTDPLLAALANDGGLTEVHALPSTIVEDPETSPAIDAGDDARCPNNDQRGSIRPADGDGDGQANCDIGSYERFELSSDLQISNITAPDRVDRTNEFTVSIEVTNGSLDTGDTGVELVTEPLPAEVSYISGPAGCSLDAGTDVVTCTIGDLAARASATVDLKLLAEAVGRATIAATITGTNADPIEANNTADVTVEVAGLVDLELSATASSSSVVVGRNVTVTFTVSNIGPDSDLAHDVRLGGTLPDMATLVSASPDNGTTCVEAADEVVCALGDLPIGGPSINVAVVLRADQIGVFDVAATVDGAETDPVPDNNTVQATVTVTNVPPPPSGGDDDDSLLDRLGCSLGSDSNGFDPVLPAILLITLVWVGWQRRRQTGTS